VICAGFVGRICGSNSGMIKTMDNFKSRQVKRLVVAVLASVLLQPVISVGSKAHSLEWVENNISKKGKFFRPVHKIAPKLELVDSAGKPVSAKSFAEKTLIVFFLDNGCDADCTKQLQRMAKVQSMLNITPMREAVQFVAVGAGGKPDIADLQIDPVNWVFLSGTSNFAQGAGAESVVHVVGSKGQWRADFIGLKFRLVNFLIYLNALQNSINGVKDGHGE